MIILLLSSPLIIIHGVNRLFNKCNNSTKELVCIFKFNVSILRFVFIKTNNLQNINRWNQYLKKFGGVDTLRNQ